VIVALVFGRDVPGQPTLIYGVGYGVCRFFLETRRGDLTRPHAYGLSEAQLTSIVILAACAVWYQSIATEAAFVLVAASAAWIARSRSRRELAALPHLRELDKICAVATDGERRESTLGLMVSYRQLPDGRNDWVMSSTHPAWSEATANRIAGLLWNDHEVIAGQTPGVVHVLTQ
jgi:hypothetical protein